MEKEVPYDEKGVSILRKKLFYEKRLRTRKSKFKKRRKIFYEKETVL